MYLKGKYYDTAVGVGLLVHQSGLLYRISGEFQSHLIDGTLDSCHVCRREVDFLEKSGWFPSGQSVRFRTGFHNVSLNLIDGCNMGCVYCNVGPKGSYNRKKTTKMTPETAKRSVDFMLDHSDNNHVGVYFFGGEPLLNWETILETLKYTATIPERNWKYDITTNGSLITEDIAGKLAEYGVSVSVTIDGPPELHNTQRPLLNGKSSHDAVVDGVKKLRKHGVRMQLSAVYMKGSALSYDEVHSYLEWLSGGEVSFKIQNEQGAMQYDRNFKVEQYKREIELAHETKEKILASKEFDLRGAFIEYLWRLVLGSSGSPAGCPVGREGFQVSPDGDLYVCHIAEAIGKFRVGNVYTGFNEESLLSLGKKFLAPTEKCKSCWAYELCGKECPLTHAMQRELKGSAEPYPEYCNMTEKMIEIAVEAVMRMERKHLEKLASRCDPVNRAKIIESYNFRNELNNFLSHIRPVFLFPIGSGAKPIQLTYVSS